MRAQLWPAGLSPVPGVKGSMGGVKWGAQLWPAGLSPVPGVKGFDHITLLITSPSITCSGLPLASLKTTDGYFPEPPFASLPTFLKANVPGSRKAEVGVRLSGRR